MQESWVQSLGREDPLEKEMATHSSILGWKIPGTEGSGGLLSMGSQQIRHNWAPMHIHTQYPSPQGQHSCYTTRTSTISPSYLELLPWTKWGTSLPFPSHLVMNSCLLQSTPSPQVKGLTFVGGGKGPFILVLEGLIFASKTPSQEFL